MGEASATPIQQDLAPMPLGPNHIDKAYRGKPTPTPNPKQNPRSNTKVFRKVLLSQVTVAAQGRSIVKTRNPWIQAYLWRNSYGTPLTPG